MGKIVLDLSRDVASPTKESDALATALAETGTTVEKIQKEGGKTDGELLLARCGEDFTKESYCLAYAFYLTDEKDKLPYRVYVDATTNKVIKRLPLYDNCFESSLLIKPKPSIAAETALKPSSRTFSPLVASTFIPNRVRYLAGQGVLNFDTEPIGSNFALRFNSQNQNSALQVQRDLNNNGEFDDGDVLNLNTTWGNNSPNATTAHWVCQRMYQYMLNTHSRNGVDNNGAIARVTVESPLENNARWKHFVNEIEIGFRGPTGRSLATVDILSHELMHGYTNYMAGSTGLNGTFDSRTLNEALSDMFAAVMEHELLPNDWNWTLGEDAWLLRNMSNPELSERPQPRTFQGPNWNAWPNVHHNNGFLNRWFFLLSQGENDPNSLPRVYPIGMDRAARIVFWTMQLILQPSTSFVNFRDATRYASQFLYGPCSHENRQMINAWNNVNFPTGFNCAPDCNFSITGSASPSTVPCGSPVTLTANCSGSGCQYINYSWSGSVINSSDEGRIATINSASNPGTTFYTVSANKAGCSTPIISGSASVTTTCGCTPPNAPSLTANPTSVNSGQPSDLSASGCPFPGTVSWSNGLGNGYSKTVFPSTTTTYTATCTVNGCTSGNGQVTITVNGNPPSGSCSAIDPQCSGNQYELRNYTVSVPSSGSYTLRVTYRSHEGNGAIRWSVNGSGAQTTQVSQTALDPYQEADLGSASLNAGNNTITLSSGALYVCFRKVCANSGGARLGVAEETAATDSPELTVSPNPSDGEFVVRFYVEPGRKATLRVSDIQGREVWKKNLTGQGAHSEPVRLPAQSIGTYLLLLDKEAIGEKGKSEFKRVIVVR